MIAGIHGTRGSGGPAHGVGPVAAPSGAAGDTGDSCKNPAMDANRVAPVTEGLVTLTRWRDSRSPPAHKRTDLPA